MASGYLSNEDKLLEYTTVLIWKVIYYLTIRESEMLVHIYLGWSEVNLSFMLVCYVIILPGYKKNVPFFLPFWVLEMAQTRFSYKWLSVWQIYVLLYLMILNNKNFFVITPRPLLGKAYGQLFKKWPIMLPISSIPEPFSCTLDDFLRPWCLRTIFRQPQIC